MTPPFDIIMIPPTITNIYYQLMDFCIYAIMAWYIENVFPGEFGTPKPWFFFLMPSYWGFTRNKSQDNKDQKLVVHQDEDDDVAEERRKLFSK